MGNFFQHISKNALKRQNYSLPIEHDEKNCHLAKV